MWTDWFEAVLAEVLDQTFEGYGFYTDPVTAKIQIDLCISRVVLNVGMVEEIPAPTDIPIGPYAMQLYAQARLRLGGQVSDPAEVVETINRLALMQAAIAAAEYATGQFLTEEVKKSEPRTVSDS